MIMIRTYHVLFGFHGENSSSIKNFLVLMQNIQYGEQNLLRGGFPIHFSARGGNGPPPYGGGTRSGRGMPHETSRQYD